MSSKTKLEREKPHGLDIIRQESLLANILEGSWKEQIIEADIERNT